VFFQWSTPIYGGGSRKLTKKANSRGLHHGNYQRTKKFSPMDKLCLERKWGMFKEQEVDKYSPHIEMHPFLLLCLLNSPGRVFPPRSVEMWLKTFMRQWLSGMG
jgi:hypothetical protein